MKGRKLEFRSAETRAEQREVDDFVNSQTLGLMGVDMDECKVVEGRCVLFAPTLYRLEDNLFYAVGRAERQKYMQMAGFSGGKLVWTRCLMIGHFTEGLVQIKNDCPGFKPGDYGRGEESETESDKVKTVIEEVREQPRIEQVIPRPPQAQTSTFEPPKTSNVDGYMEDARLLAVMFGPEVANCVERVERSVLKLLRLR